MIDYRDFHDRVEDDTCVGCARCYVNGLDDSCPHCFGSGCTNEAHRERFVEAERASC